MMNKEIRDKYIDMEIAARERMRDRIKISFDSVKRVSGLTLSDIFKENKFIRSTIDDYLYSTNSKRVPAQRIFNSIEKMLKKYNLQPLSKQIDDIDLIILNLVDKDTKRQMSHDICKYMYLTNITIGKLEKYFGMPLHSLSKIKTPKGAVNMNSFTLYVVLEYLKKQPFCEYVNELLDEIW